MQGASLPKKRSAQLRVKEACVSEHRTANEPSTLPGAPRPAGIVSVPFLLFLLVFLLQAVQRREVSHGVVVRKASLFRCRHSPNLVATLAKKRLQEASRILGDMGSRHFHPRPPRFCRCRCPPREIFFRDRLLTTELTSPATSTSSLHQPPAVGAVETRK